MLLFPVNLASDLDIIIKFRQEMSAASEVNFDAVAYVHRLKEKLNDYPEGQLVLKNNQEIIGMIGFFIDDTNMGYINQLYLKPQFRGVGLGKELIAYAESYFLSEGVLNYQLNVYKTNISAIDFYYKLGFKSVDYNITKLRMTKAL